VKGQVVTNWNQALEQLMLDLPRPHRALRVSTPDSCKQDKTDRTTDVDRKRDTLRTISANTSHEAERCAEVCVKQHAKGAVEALSAGPSVADVAAGPSVAAYSTGDISLPTWRQGRRRRFTPRQ